MRKIYILKLRSKVFYFFLIKGHKKAWLSVNQAFPFKVKFRLSHISINRDTFLHPLLYSIYPFVNLFPVFQPENNLCPPSQLHP